MKRPLLIIVICLLLGAVVNVAVAWGCAVFVDPIDDPDSTFAVRAAGHRTWELMKIERFGLTCFWSKREWLPDLTTSPPYGGPTPETLLPSWSDLAEPTGDFFLAVESNVDKWIVERRNIYCYEWPLRSVWRDWHQVGTRGSVAWNSHIEIWDNWIPRLAFRPIWPGFAVNTIFYAAILWVLIGGLFVLRRFLRVKRGLCPKCAYPMGESSVCTECGCELRATP